MTVSAIVGRPGAGKSFVMAKIAAKAMRRNNDVFANFDIKGVPRFGIEDLPHLPPGIVLIDEAQNLFHARMWATMPPEMLERWSQTRKAGWKVFIGTQHEDNVDSVIRRVIQYGWLLEARWQALNSPLDPSAGHPLYVFGRMWDWPDFRQMRKGHKPLRKKRWWWDQKVADLYDTLEVTHLRGTERQAS